MVVPILPTDINSLIVVLADIIRRAVDGTTVPIFVDYTNQRIIIGGISASASPATLEIASGDAKIVTGGKGLILPSRDGLNFGRVLLENVDPNGNLIISVDPL